MTPRDRHVRVSDVFASLYGTGYGTGAMEAECTLRRSIWRLGGRRVPRGSCVPQGSCARFVCPESGTSVRQQVRLSDSRDLVCSGHARARVSGPSSCVRVSGPVCPARFVCPESGTSVRQQVRLSDSRDLVCSGHARARVSGPSSCVRVSGPTQELVCPGGKSVCPTLGLDSGADSGARFVRVSGPGSSVSQVRPCVRAGARAASPCVRLWG